jgi:hypothetical protein
LNVIEGATDEGLKMAAIESEIFRGIHSGLLRIAERLRLRCAKRDNHNAWPFRLHLREKRATFLRPQIDEKD